jgi:hypothetical protein
MIRSGMANRITPQLALRKNARMPGRLSKKTATPRKVETVAVGAVGHDHR